MLKSLRIQNFKGWVDTTAVRLAPITVFFGSNSSGKSSLIQFLLMLRQTAESPDRRRVLHPGDRNTPVELGTYRDLVFGHDPTRDIHFDIAWDLNAPLTIKDPLTEHSASDSTLKFSATIASDSSGAQQHVARLRYELGSVAIEMSSPSQGKYELQAQGYKLVRNQGRPWKLPPPVRFYGFPDEVGVYFQNAGFTGDLALALETQLKQIQYLGPLRTHPARSYVWSGEVPEHVGWRGERAVEAMLAARGRKIVPKYKSPSRPFEALIAFWLKELGLLHAFEVKAIGENRKEYEVFARTQEAGAPVSLPDVGFGVSQILPVIVQCFYAPPHTTILLEQPEIHLHPAVQTALADLFISTIRSRENGSDRSIQLIIESHSEHFLQRLQRRVAEEVISPDDVALYFCDRKNGSADLRSLPLDLFGQITAWPDGFFGDQMAELSARLEAAAKRQ